MFVSNNLKVAWLLAITRLKRTSILATGLIVIVMTLTFLNLLVVRGILIGLPTGAVLANQDKYYSDILISAKKGKKHIESSSEIQKVLENTPGIKNYGVRYITSGLVSEDSDERVSNDEDANEINAPIIGMDIHDEELIIGISDNLYSGRMFFPNSRDEVVVGSDLLSDFEFGEATGRATLDDVNLGSDLIITVAGKERKVSVVGVTKGKVSEIDGRVLVSFELLKELVGRDDFKPDEMAIKVKEDYDINDVKNQIISTGVNKYADIEGPDEYQPSFVEDLINTFAILGDVIGTISLVVAAITVFIIIFVNALTQRKSIGILKGIGISPWSIELSYIIQALFYVLLGAAISLPLLYGVLVPAFEANPIDFPFADGVLVAETATTISRTISMIIVTGIAGYLPARYIVQQNTLDSILGR